MGKRRSGDHGSSRRWGFQRAARNNRQRESFAGGHPAPMQQIFPPMLEIGDWVITKLSEAVEDVPEGHDWRVMLVYGIHRNDNYVVAVDFLNASTKEEWEGYPADLVGDELYLGFEQRKPLGRKQCVLGTSNVVTVSNKVSHVKREIIGKLPKELWPDVLARRVHAVLFNPGLSYQCKNLLLFNNPQTTREGFALDIEVPPEKWAPDLPGGFFKRGYSSIVTPDQIGRITRYARDYTAARKAEGNHFFSFSPSAAWPNEILGRRQEREIARDYLLDAGVA